MSTIIGANASVKQGQRHRWMVRDGEQVARIWRGPLDKVQTQYDELKEANSNTLTPEYDALELEAMNGRGTLTATIADTTSLIADDTSGVDTYEMLPNQIRKPIEQAPYFATATPILNGDDIVAVYDAFDKRLTEAKANFADKKLVLYRLLCKGIEEFLETAFVLRKTTVASNRSSIQASYENVGNVVEPPNASMVTPIIGALPQGEWLKMAPMVRTLGKRKWEIVQEWWWATAWSAVLYPGGTGEP